MATPVLMFMNMKGGVGKTTLAVEISRTLAYDYDKSVLLIDYDPQANASFAFLETATYFKLLDDGKSIAHCLMPSFQSTDPFAIVQASVPNDIDVTRYSHTVRNWFYPNDNTKKAGSLHLVPGNLQLMRLALNELSPEVNARLQARWSALLASAKNTIRVRCGGLPSWRLVFH